MKKYYPDPIQMASIHDFNKDNKDDDDKNQGGGIFIGQMPSGIQHAQQFDEEDDILIDYNDKAKSDQFSEAFYRDAQIEQVCSILSTKKKPNALLVGDAGVGKTQIVEEIARRLVDKDPIVYGMLGDANIYELPLGRIVSGSSLVGQLEEKIYEVIQFAQDPDNKAILFIDEIHQITGSSATNPTYDKIAQILKPALGRGNLRMIGATTTQEAAGFLDDPALSRRWSDVQIPELSPSQTGDIIEKIRDGYQKHHDVILPETLIDQLVAIGDEYKQYGSHRPDTSITLLDKAMADARIKRLKLKERAKDDPTLNVIIQAQPKPILSASDLTRSALALLTGDSELYRDNAQLLKDRLDQTIIGQKDAKSATIDAVKRLGLGLTKRKRPVSFLFAGPSGTGKTEIAKQITEAVYGASERMIYINMSEFSSPASMTRIIGSSAGYVGSDSKRELPFDSLENNPYQLVLLDEFEKAHTDVQRFFMQALDEGVVKTNRNKTIDFTRTIMIATTNAGAIDFSKNTVGFSASSEPVPHTVDDMIHMLKSSFDVELLNRFEKLIPFTAIDKDDYIKILAVKYNQIVKEAQENRKDLALSPSDIDIDQANTYDTLVKLADESYAPSSNGRPAERTIREHIENTILDDMNATQFTLL